MTAEPTIFWLEKHLLGTANAISGSIAALQHLSGTPKKRYLGYNMQNTSQGDLHRGITRLVSLPIADMCMDVVIWDMQSST